MLPPGFVLAVSPLLFPFENGRALFAEGGNGFFKIISIHEVDRQPALDLERLTLVRRCAGV